METDGEFLTSASQLKREVFGFVGTNGAGKTTTIRHMMGFLKPQSGNATINGMDCWKDSAEIKKMIGYIPGEIAFPDAPTGTEFLKRQAELLGLKDMSYVESIIKKLQLDPTANLKRMSKGMKQKTAIVAALMADPEILILMNRQRVLTHL
ncbi:ATP-binding cassette domain-containing protein [Bacillus pacificus]